MKANQIDDFYDMTSLFLKNDYETYHLPNYNQFKKQDNFLSAHYYNYGKKEKQILNVMRISYAQRTLDLKELQDIKIWEIEDMIRNGKDARPQLLERVEPSRLADEIVQKYRFLHMEPKFEHMDVKRKQFCDYTIPEVRTIIRQSKDPVTQIKKFMDKHIEQCVYDYRYKKNCKSIVVNQFTSGTENYHCLVRPNPLYYDDREIAIHQGLARTRINTDILEYGKDNSKVIETECPIGRILNDISQRLARFNQQHEVQLKELYTDSLEPKYNSNQLYNNNLNENNLSFCNKKDYDLTDSSYQFAKFMKDTKNRLDGKNRALDSTMASIDRTHSPVKNDSYF